MAQLALSVAAAAVGFAIGGPTGAQIGFALGSIAGAGLAPTQQTSGPRLSDTKFSGLEYGASVPWYHGTMRMSGIPIYLSDKREVATTTESGGKGGGGVESTTYTYNCDALYLLADCESDALIEVYRQGELIYTSRSTASAESRAASSSTDAWQAIRFYGGASSQDPDPDYEAAQGVGNAPAYVGRTTVFIKGLQLDGGGNLPQLSFVISRNSTAGTGDVLLLMNWNGANNSTTFVDESSYGVTVTDGGAHLLKTAVSRFGTASLTTTASGGLVGNFGGSYATNQSITIECWMYLAANPDANMDIVLIRTDSDTGNVAWIKWVDENTPDKKAWSVRFGDINLGTTSVVLPDVNHPLGSWMFLELTYSAPEDRLRFFVNGNLVLTGTGAGATISTSGARFRVADVTSPPTDTIYFDGLRITRNVARHTSEYTPPTAAPTDDGLLPQTPNAIALQTVTSDLCTRAGLTSGQIDVTALSGTVDGIISGQIAPVRGILEQLGRCYLFEASEAATLKFIPRGGASVATIPFGDLGAGLGDAAAEPLTVERANDLESPAQVAVSYLNLADSYQSGAEYSDRIVTRSNSVAQQQLAIALTPAAAKGRADTYVIDATVARTRLRFAVGLAYAQLETGDVVTVADNEGNSYRCRLVKISETGGVRECEAVLDDAQALSTSGITSSYYAPATTVAAPGETVLYLLDGPLLRDADSVPGHYVAVTGSGRWPGAAALDSLTGTEYTEEARITENGIAGTCATALANWTGGHVWDEVSTVRVSVNAPLSSYTRDQILNDSSLGAYLIGAHGRWECINARTATFVSTGVHRRGAHHRERHRRHVRHGAGQLDRRPCVGRGEHRARVGQRAALQLHPRPDPQRQQLGCVPHRRAWSLGVHQRTHCHVREHRRV